MHRHLLAALLMGLFYWVLENYSLSLARVAGGISYIWPANGLVLGALLCTRIRYWPVYLLVVFVVSSLTLDGPPLQGMLYALFNAAEPALVALVAVALLGVQPRINNVWRVLVVVASIVIVVGLATLVATFIRSLTFPIEFLRFWAIWYVSDVLGMLIVGMLIACVSSEWRSYWETLSGARLWEAAAMLVGLIAVTHLFFAVLPQSKEAWIEFSSTPLVGSAMFLLWGAIRFGLMGAAISFMILALQTYAYTAYGLGPIALHYPGTGERMVHLQVTLALTDFAFLVVAAVATERRQARLESIASRRRLEFAIKASDMLVFEVDPATQTIHWSGDTMAVLGQPAAAVADVAEWMRCVHPDDRGSVEQRYRDVTRGTTASANFDYRLRFGEDGDWMSLGAAAYAVPPKGRTINTRPSEMRVIGVMKNVTEKKRLEQEKRGLEERLRQAEKMEAIGGLAGGIAHDFNNILGAILGYAEMSQSELPAGSEVRRYIDTIVTAGERGKDLVAQIGTFSRINRTEAVPVDMKALVAEVAATLRGSMPENVLTGVDLTDAPAFVLGNATQLYQLIMNLAANSIQAMPAGGDLGISLQVVENGDEQVLQAGTLARGRYVVLAVEDQGMGMGGEVLPRIFEPFFSTKARNKGTGLGLAIVHGVVLGHGGAIDVQSVPERGTRFTVYLPACARIPAGPESSAGVARGNGEVIMVVDDEPAMVTLAEDLLAQLGYEPMGFTSSREALAAFLSAPGRFDGVLTDELMPEMTGTELSAKLRAVNARLPIVAVSGFGGPDFESRARDAGVSRIMTKPYVKADLARAIAAVLAK